MALPQIELQKLLQNEAAEIARARDRAMIVHHARNIDAAGDEVERTVRDLVRRRLPPLFEVAEGHIVDADWTTSPQLDVIIGSRRDPGILFQLANDTTYFSFESVYAFGEIKSGYYSNQRYLHKLVETNKKIRTELKRERVPPDYVHGIELGPGFRATTGSWRYRNPLFSFAFFGTANDFKHQDVADLYRDNKPEDLPNVTVFMDKGLLVSIDVTDHKSGDPVRLVFHPEFHDPRRTLSWVLLEFQSDENVAAASLAALQFALILN